MSEAPPKTTHVALVGHCGFDSGPLKSFVRRTLPDAEVSRVNDRKSLDDLTHGGALLLVNRVLDGGFATEMGVELIGDLAKADDPPRMLLISNYEDAQAAAEDAGARPGFGKGDLGTDIAADRLRNAAVG
ncbi:MAG: hypothetical protein AAF800_02760 [Planctomycetota bacterium]